jgi:aminocarboxymuconate-semialdehyde decarboxylase
MVAESKGKLVTLAQVPLQDTEAACEEASRAMRAGHKGIQIGNHVGPLDLDADHLIAFLHHCADDNVPYSFILLP